MAKKILIIDDEPKIVKICSDYLEAAGFEVVSENEGLQGLAEARREDFDLIILDLMLPGIDGLDICRKLRREGDIPIIMLTARVEESDKLVGLELGADDYMTKPFSPRELVARVRTVLRRVSGNAVSDILRVGDLIIDRARYRVSFSSSEREITLTPTECDILVTLANHPGRIFTRAQLLTATRGIAFESYERTIDSHIRNLRRKVDLEECEARHIITVHGVGYKFEA